MISFIICSGKNDLTELKSNINISVGLEHEIIVIKNIGAKYTIAQAYNSGIKDSKYPFLCFIHDDVKILSENWGSILLEEWNSLDNPGLIGVIGTQYKSIFPSPWTCPDETLNKGRLWQFSKYLKKSENLINYSSDPEPVQVSVVDGVFLFTNKSIFESNSVFDENLKGFHCYDIDLALKIDSFDKKVFVTHNLLIVHYSEGKLNNDWFENQLYINKKWKKKLPLNITNKGCVDFNLEVKCFKRSIYVFLKNKISIRIRLKYILFYLFFDRISTREYLIIIFKNMLNTFSKS